MLVSTIDLVIDSLSSTLYQTIDLKLSQSIIINSEMRGILGKFGIVKYREKQTQE